MAVFAACSSEKSNHRILTSSIFQVSSLFVPVVLSGSLLRERSSHQPLYTLATKGLQVLRDAGSAEYRLTVRRTAPEYSASTVLHHVVVSDCLVSLVVALRVHADLELVSAVTESELWLPMLRHRGRGERQPLIVPDGAFTIRHRLTGETMTFYLEVVRCPRMQSLLGKLCHAGVLAGVTLLVLIAALQDEQAAARLASRVPDEELRHYLTDVLPREPRASKDALASRLHWLLLIPEVRASLCAPTALAGADILEAPLSVIDLGGDIPMGFLPLVEVVASLLMTIVTMAIFSRKVPAHPVLCIIDEWQVIAPKSGAELERTLAQARFRQVSLILANQTLGQISDTSLLRSLLTNICTSASMKPCATSTWRKGIAGACRSASSKRATPRATRTCASSRCSVPVGT